MSQTLQSQVYTFFKDLFTSEGLKHYTREFINLIQVELNHRKIKREVQNYQWQEGEESHTFVWDIAEVSQYEITFSDTLDLFYSLATATLTGTMEATVRRNDLRLTQLKVIGEVTDTYDWDYEEAFIDSIAAPVQAGYNTLGIGGRIFKTRVGLYGTVSLRHLRHFSFK